MPLLAMDTMTPPNEQHQSSSNWQSTNLGIEGLISEEDFDLDYMQWISGVDFPSYLE